MINRRNFLQASALVAGSTASRTEANHAGGVEGLLDKGKASSGLIDRRSLINHERAYAVMAKHKIDGLIALQAINVFYLSNHLGYKFRFGAADPGFAVMPRKSSKSVQLVTSVVDQWHIANAEREYPDIVPYTGPVNWLDYVGRSEKWQLPPKAGGGISWTKDEEQLSQTEQTWLSMDAKQKDQYAPTAIWGLVEALRRSDLHNARLAVDDMRIASLLKMAGLENIQCIDGDNIFREIRMVKSEVEINFMRTAARVNQQAAHLTMKQITSGATAADVEFLFRIEAAKLGAEMDFFSLGTYGGLRNGEIIKDEPLMIDAVCKVNGYCGDYGRTFVSGTPSLRVEKRVTQLDAARQAVFEMLKPGVRYSEIQAVARKAMAGAGLPSDVIARVTPHSVGLSHTDEAMRYDLPFPVKDDLTLLSGMVITIDLPCYELGWGSTHLEDITLITEDGAEILAEADSPLIVGN